MLAALRQSLLITAVVGSVGWAPSLRTALPARCGRPQPAKLRMAEAADDMPPGDAEDELMKGLNEMQMQEFNKGLYAHLNKRPEYETSNMYSALRKRQDVDDPLYSELKERREMLANAPLPNEDQTPGEVIELVLRALRDVDWPRPGHGAEMLMTYSGPASILGNDGTAVTADMVRRRTQLHSLRTERASRDRPRRPAHGVSGRGEVEAEGGPPGAAARAQQPPPCRLRVWRRSLSRSPSNAPSASFAPTRACVCVRMRRLACAAAGVLRVVQVHHPARLGLHPVPAQARALAGQEASLAAPQAHVLRGRECAGHLPALETRDGARQCVAHRPASRQDTRSCLRALRWLSASVGSLRSGACVAAALAALVLAAGRCAWTALTRMSHG